MDPIANMIVIMKNGARAGREVVFVPYSQVKHAILTCLEKEGYVASISKKVRAGVPGIEITLGKNDKGEFKLHDVARLSKPSCRVYKASRELSKFKGGIGSYILSTPKGIMTDKEARKELVGGELLLSIW